MKMKYFSLGLNHGVCLFDMPEHLQDRFIQGILTHFFEKSVICDNSEIAKLSLVRLFTRENAFHCWVFRLNGTTVRRKKVM